MIIVCWDLHSLPSSLDQSEKLSQPMSIPEYVSCIVPFETGRKVSIYQTNNMLWMMPCPLTHGTNRISLDRGRMSALPSAYVLTGLGSSGCRTSRATVSHRQPAQERDKGGTTEPCASANQTPCKPTFIYFKPRIRHQWRWCASRQEG